jgi:hypothetical protein
MKSRKGLLLIALFFLITTSLKAQLTANPGEYVIQWDDQQLPAGSTPSSQKIRLSFAGGDYDKNFSPVYILSLYGQSVNNIIIVPTETAVINDKDRFFIPTVIDSTRSEVVFYNGVPSTIVRFIPLIITSTGVSKIVRFKIESTEVPYAMPQRTLIRNSDLNSGAARTSATTGSVLSSGRWIKFPVTQSGLYVIDYNYLQTNGFNPSSFTPSEIHLYGNGGGMLPQANSAARFDDLMENTIQIVGDADGSFDPGDYILFYARGPHVWNYNTNTSLYEHAYNLYSEQAYYFLTVGAANGLRISSKSSLGSAAQSFNTFDDHQFYESDQYNVMKSGRYWYGDLFSVNTFSAVNHSFDWAGGVAGSPVTLSLSALGRANVATSLSVIFNQTSSFVLPLSAIPNTSYPPFGVATPNTNYTITPAAAFNQASVDLIFNNSGNFTAQANLDYIRVQGQRTLQLYNSQTTFRCKNSITQPTSEYRIQNANSSLMVWDVTDSIHPVNVNYNLIGTEAVFSDQSDVIREYVCFNGNSFYSPGTATLVNNQNLHSYNSPNLPDVVIVTHPSLQAEATQLANHRHNKDNMDVIVVTTEEVYNEFSSGAQDITAIRDFMKMLHDRNTATDSVRFLVLFGSCSYDYKDRIPNNKNLVPCYESRNSLDPLASYSSEDYFGFMDNNEGTWPESPAVNAGLDISVGRIPARSIEDATMMVNKIIHYQTAISTEAKWKNRITFVCDDGDGDLHLQDAEDNAAIVASMDGRYNLNKIYLDAYPQETTAGGEKAPVVNDLIDKDIAKGTFIMNYSGHGGTGAWAQELILTLAQAEAWTNIDAMPLMVTATCNFGLYDDPSITTGSDAVLFNANGGAIGMVTSTREVFEYSNKALNQSLYKTLFVPYGTDLQPRMGDVFKVTKNKSLIDVNNRNYAFLGDPSMRLAFPQESMVITKINGTPVSSTADTIKALSKVVIAGEVRDQNNVIISGYNGTASITCFDKENIITTLGSTSDSPPYTFKLLNNVFFEGQVSITNGAFSVTFIVPKDISYLYDKGKISLYGLNTGTNQLNDAAGYYGNVQIGGSNSAAPVDNTPPVANLFMNDLTFVSGGLTNNNPLFIANVSDASGINVGTSGIGHEITITMSNNPNAIILNDYYSTTVDSYTSGSVRYPLKDLPAGNYSITFKVWDTYNNSTTSHLEFTVANTDKLALDHVLNYPNPFSTHTEFHFDHNRAGDDLEVLIEIYTVAGKMIKSIDHVDMSSSTHVSGFTWDGRDDFGDKIGKGVYVYKLKVRSLRDGSTTHQYQKLMLLN